MEVAEARAHEFLEQRRAAERNRKQVEANLYGDAIVIPGKASNVDDSVAQAAPKPKPSDKPSANAIRSEKDIMEGNLFEFLGIEVYSS